MCVRTSPLKVGQDLGVESLVLGAATHILIKSSFECGAIHTIAIKLKCHRLFFNSLQVFCIHSPQTRVSRNIPLDLIVK